MNGDNTSVLESFDARGRDQAAVFKAKRFELELKNREKTFRSDLGTIRQAEGVKRL
jgi:hypothetical protein